VIVEFSPKAWQDMYTWAQWCKSCPQNANHQQILYLDNLKTHFSDSSSTILKGKNINARHLIPNATHFIQPVDQNVGVTLQRKIREKYLKYKIEQHDRIAKTQYSSKLSIDGLRKLVCSWISDAWNDIIENHNEMLQKSWKNTGLLLKLDESEDIENFANFL
jgi:DDE superfamily endonuclease